MNKETFDILDAINQSGYSTSMWGVCEDVDTKERFGTVDDAHLDGQFLYVYHEKVDSMWIDCYDDGEAAAMELQDGGMIDFYPL